MDIKKFRLNLAKERIKKNLSAYELSLCLGKDRTYISKIENGANLSLPVIFEICEILEIEPKTLFED